MNHLTKFGACAIGLVWLSGCLVPEVNLAGKACSSGHPCIPGYVCTAGICRANSGSGAAAGSSGSIGGSTSSTGSREPNGSSASAATSTGSGSSGTIGGSSAGATSSGSGALSSGSAGATSGAISSGGSSGASASSATSGGTGSGDQAVRVTTLDLGGATFDGVDGLAVDVNDNIYVAVYYSNRVFKVDASGEVTTVAGNGVAGFVDGMGGPDGGAEFDGPAGVAVGPRGNIFVADDANNRIRKIDSSRYVTTFAGNGKNGYADGTGGADGGAEFDNPTRLAVGFNGDVYVADCVGGNRVRKIDPSGNVTTLAGNGVAGFRDGSGGADGGAELNQPHGVAVDSSGDVYVADEGNNRIRKIDPSGNVTTLAGNGRPGFADGSGGPDGGAKFDAPRGVAVDAHGDVFVADHGNNRIREIDPSGNVTTLAGNGNAADVDGNGGPDGGAEFDGPTGVAVDLQGNIYVTDEGDDAIRKISP